jgi:hypothetical protein
MTTVNTLGIAYLLIPRKTGHNNTVIIPIVGCADNMGLSPCVCRADKRSRTWKTVQIPWLILPWINTAAGLYLIVRARGRNHKRKGIGWILLVMTDHFLYDTPIGDALLFNAILTAAVVLPVILFFGSPEMAAGESQRKETVLTSSIFDTQ